MQRKTIDQAAEILTDVLVRGLSFRAAGARHGIGKSTAERQVKVLVRLAASQTPIKGLRGSDLNSLALLRNARDEVLRSVAAFDPATPIPAAQLAGDDELPVVIRSVRSQSENANRDVALLLLIISTGAKPLEIARMRVCDYLDRAGTLREFAVPQTGGETGKGGRRLYFASQRLCDAIDAYLVERLRRGLGTSGGSDFRGLDPDSRLFMTKDGRPFAVKARGPHDPRPICPVVVAICRRILTRAGLQGVTTHALRRQLAQRLTARGASRQRVGELLGIASTRSVGRLLRASAPTAAQLFCDAG